MTSSHLISLSSQYPKQRHYLGPVKLQYIDISLRDCYKSRSHHTTDLITQYDVPSYSHLNLTISTQSTTEWNDWFNQTEHYYKRRPSRRLTHHQHHTRLDSIALFKLRSNKGWNPEDPIGTQTPPPCICDNTTPRDGAHICQCPMYSRIRPPDILEWIHSDKHINSVLKWVCHHRHFNLKASTSQVKWINLTKPGNLEQNRVFNCAICA